MIYVLRFWDKKPENSVCVNTCSKSDTWSKRLSPFVLGPVKLWAGHTAKNVENAWQFSKVYPEHAWGKELDYLPKPQWFRWARKGWADPIARRYPMGKGQKPLYSWWDGKKLSYVEARKRVYCPLYAKAVKKTSAYRTLIGTYQQARHQAKHLVLMDYDAYDHRKLGMNLRDVLNCPTRKMGHAFVLMMMLLDKRRWEN